MSRLGMPFSIFSKRPNQYHLHVNDEGSIHCTSSVQNERTYETIRRFGLLLPKKWFIFVLNTVHIYYNMKVISSIKFRVSQKKYLDIAATKRIIIKWKNEFIEIVHHSNSIPDNPCPGNDLYFDNPQIIERIEKALKQVKEGKVIELTSENQKVFLG